MKILNIIPQLCQLRCEGANCSDCPDRYCKDCPEKPGAAKKVVEKMRAWWAATPFATSPEKDKQQHVGKKEEEEDKKEKPWWKFWVSEDKKK